MQIVAAIARLYWYHKCNLQIAAATPRLYQKCILQIDAVIARLYWYHKCILQIAAVIARLYQKCLLQIAAFAKCCCLREALSNLHKETTSQIEEILRITMPP